MLLLSGLFAESLPSVDQPGEPPNAPGDLRVSGNEFTLDYGGARILSAVSSGPVSVAGRASSVGPVEQRIRVSGEEGRPVVLKITIHASSQAIAAETSGAAQRSFPIVRTSHGLSHNRRNNAVYDRFGDWMIEMPGGETRIKPVAQADGSTRFEIEIKSDRPEIIFRPRYYQKHKNIEYFEPWTYEVRKDSITGWCSWWAYLNDFREEDLKELLDVWQQKRLADYGYTFIQIDDGFQGGVDGERRNNPLNYGYVGGRPETWLEWRTDRFPSGMTGYVDAVRRAGFSPGVWVGCFFSDEATVEQHPDWFVEGENGEPFAGPYVSYAIDATVPEAANRLVRPTYRGLEHAGFDYVKIDQLRHLLYDNLNHNPEYAASRGYKPADIFRAYLTAVRQELGRDTFVLSCWGVLPESVGLADACRIGGDGYGPVTMQQYNSWNGIVWRNDPDHCDVRPHRKPAEIGNVRKTEKVIASGSDTIIRPALASIAGCMLMLSDKPEVYADDRNLVGIRRSSPVLFSVPGQLYNFDSSKTNVLKDTRRGSVISGAGMSPIDGDQHGEVCPWWLNEFNLGFSRWNVLHHLNWSDTAVAPKRVRFKDLGLDENKEYAVYEFWTDRFLGLFKGSFETPAIGAMGLHSLAIHERQDRPHILSTNRHLSQ
ncbi:MAG TPA: alpha-galactosidase, partial [Opitutales bacterium]|nr:alpha-galactosidase [Opitutales bacterium]